MNNKVSVFLPTRKNSERVINKNTRDFCGIKGGLLKLKLEELLKMDNIDEIILSTNDEASIEVASQFNNPVLKVIERPNHLCLSETLVSDLISYVPTIVSNEIIYWVHATAPFVTYNDYNSALETFFINLKSNQSDSLASVSKIQQFIWDDEEKKMINFDISGGSWPRTQDLKPLYEINHAFYINTRANYIKYNNRVSPSMSIFPLDKIKQFDIDWEEDFYLAELIYTQLKKNQ